MPCRGRLVCVVPLAPAARYLWQERRVVVFALPMPAMLPGAAAVGRAKAPLASLATAGLSAYAFRALGSLLVPEPPR